MEKLDRISEFWKNKQVFVTGATGFVGGWLTQKLVEHNIDVVCLIRDYNPNSLFRISGLDKKVKIVYGSINNFDLLKRILTDYNIDTVFHLAAQSQVVTARKNPIDAFKTNIEGTWNLLEATRQCNVERVIVASSDKAYGTTKILPYEETFELKGEYPYEASKTCCDILAQMYYSTYKLPVVISRNGNTFGGGDFNFMRLIPETIKSVLMNENPVLRSNGKFSRDFLYVDDAVKSYLVLAENIHREDVIGQAFNFSMGKSEKIIDVVNKIIKIAKKDHLTPIIMDNVSHEIKDQSLSCKKANNLLGLKFDYNLDKGLKKTIDWYKNYF